MKSRRLAFLLTCMSTKRSVSLLVHFGYQVLRRDMNVYITVLTCIFCLGFNSSLAVPGPRAAGFCLTSGSCSLHVYVTTVCLVGLLLTFTQLSCLSLFSRSFLASQSIQIIRWRCISTKLFFLQWSFLWFHYFWVYSELWVWAFTFKVNG